MPPLIMAQKQMPRVEHALQIAASSLDVAIVVPMTALDVAEALFPSPAEVT